MSTRNISGG